ncbi:MAG: hypothetical protein KDA21_14610, partial [Phycisphaerales bacterium]|nr:hypothetical protein [Phycisphaerales bacterium]
HPVVHVDLPRPGHADTPVAQFRLGLADAYSGIDLATLSVTADTPVAGRAAGAELADLFVDQGDGIWLANLSEPVNVAGDLHLTVRLDDHQGNRTEVVRRFSVTPVIPCPGDADGSMSVNIDDLNMVLERWLDAVTPGTDGDVTNDGIVDFDDLNRVLSHWGAICN